MIPETLTKIAIVIIGALTLVALAPWFLRWLRRGRSPVITEPRGWFQRVPHILMLIHSVAVVLLLLGIDPLPFLLTRDFLPPDRLPAVLSVSGLLLFAIGNYIRLWGVVAQGNLLETELRVLAGQPLITSGPYRWARHPIYTGNLLAELGLGLALVYWPLIVFTLGISVPVWNYRARREEEMLETYFGDAYRAYKSRVGRFFTW
jgi:protein-S-isoprenylcysteine O-methyltransferase Ste14